jgi:hypothetical protein
MSYAEQRFLPFEIGCNRFDSSLLVPPLLLYSFSFSAADNTAVTAAAVCERRDEIGNINGSL